MFGLNRYHAHFSPRTIPGVRYLADEPGDGAASEGGDSGPATSGDASFESIGQATYDASQEPEAVVDSGDEPSTPADPPSDPEADAEAGAEGSAEQTTADKMAELLESAQGEALKLDPEAVPEELRPFLKSFQADHTRKTQALAEQRKRSAEELAGDELAELRTQIEELRQGRQAPEQPVAPQPTQAKPQAPRNAREYAEMQVRQADGELLTYDEVRKLEADPVRQEQEFLRYNNQQQRIAALEAVANYHSQAVAPALNEFGQMREQFTQREQQRIEGEARKQYDTFMSANPGLVQHEAVLASLVTGGMTLEQAGEFVKSATSRDTAIAEALATGQLLGKQAADKVADNKDQFDTPASSTHGKGGPTYNPEDSFEKIGEKAVKEAGLT